MIDVVGLGARGWPDLPERLRILIAEADVLIGSPRQLALVPVLTGQQRLHWPKPLREGLPALLAELSDRTVVGLASGDPLVAGVGTTLVELLGPDAVRVHPAVSSVALARARMGWSDTSCEVVRLRGGDVDTVRRHLYPGRRLVVLSRDADTPAEIAQLLRDGGQGDAVLTVLGDLDTDAESRIQARASDWSGQAPALHVLCVVCADPPEPSAVSLVPGLPDEAYDHDGQLTKRDLRASAMAHLQPRPGELLWDIGAGAGSVAIEWARAHPSCRAIAVERDADRAKRIRGNADRLGVPAVQVVIGAAPGVLAGLNPPHAVFVGGGCSAELLAEVWAELLPGGRLVVHAVTHETEEAVTQGWRNHGGRLTRLVVEHLEPLGRFHGWKPSRPVVQWSATKAAGW